MKKPNMTEIEQIEHFQTCVHTLCLLMPVGDFHHHKGSNHLKSSWSKKSTKSTLYEHCSTLLTHQISPTRGTKQQRQQSGALWLFPRLVEARQVATHTSPRLCKKIQRRQIQQNPWNQSPLLSPSPLPHLTYVMRESLPRNVLFL